MAKQRLLYVVLTEGKTKLLEVARVCAQHCDRPCIKGCAQHQFVEIIVVNVALPDLQKHGFKPLAHVSDINVKV